VAGTHVPLEPRCHTGFRLGMPRSICAASERCGSPPKRASTGVRFRRPGAFSPWFVLAVDTVIPGAACRALPAAGQASFTTAPVRSPRTKTTAATAIRIHLKSGHTRTAGRAAVRQLHAAGRIRSGIRAPRPRRVAPPCPRRDRGGDSEGAPVTRCPRRPGVQGGMDEQDDNTEASDPEEPVGRVTRRAPSRPLPASTHRAAKPDPTLART